MNPEKRARYGIETCSDRLTNSIGYQRDSI